MLNKNDPLIAAVQKVMETNQAERNAVAVVNEKFGVTDRKALPRERQHEWDSAYAKVLTEGVEALDEKINMTQSQMANLDGNPKFTGNDLRHLRNKTHVKKAAAGTLEEKKMKDDPCWDTHEMVGMKKGKGGKPVPNCVPVKEEGDPSKAIRGDVVTGGSSVTSVAPKEKSVTPDDQSALKKKIQGIMKEASLQEKITKSTPVKDVISDFVHSKNPKFSGDTKKERIKRALGAYYGKHPEKSKKTVEEGFNNRHDSSVNASVEEQVVADQLNEAGINPVLMQQRQKKAQQLAVNNKTTRNIKAREPRDPTAFERFQAREQEKPTPVIGGSPVVPLGGPAASLARTAVRNAPGILSRAYNYFKGRTSGQQSNQPGQSVPQIRQQTSSSGSSLPSGPWGSIARRGGDAGAAAGKNTRGAPSGTMLARLRQQAQQVQQGRAGGSTVGANQAAARAVSARQSSQALGGYSSAANVTAALGAKKSSQALGGYSSTSDATNALRAKKSSQALGGFGKVTSNLGNIARKNVKLPAGAAGGTAMTGFKQSSTGPENIKMATQKAADNFKFTEKERAGKVSAERLKQFYQEKGLKSSGKTTQDLRTFMNAAKNKTLNTKVTPATELQKANQAKLQAGRTTTTSSVAGGQQIAALPSGKAMSVVSTVPRPTARPSEVGSTGPARPTMAANAQAAGQMATDRMRAQDLAKSQTPSMSAGMSSTAPAPVPKQKPTFGGPR